jgi:hypothetical protein
MEARMPLNTQQIQQARIGSVMSFSYSMLQTPL